MAGKEDAAPVLDKAFLRYEPIERRLDRSSITSVVRFDHAIMSEMSNAAVYVKLWRANVRERAEQYLARNQECLNELRTALARPDLRFEFDADNDHEVPDARSVIHLRECVRLLDWEVRAACQDEDSERATRGIIDLVRLGQTLIGLPFEDARFYQSRIWRRAQVCAIGSFSRVRFDVDQLDRIDGAFKPIAHYDGFKPYMVWRCSRILRKPSDNILLVRLGLAPQGHTLQEIALMANFAQDWNGDPLERWRRANAETETVRKRIQVSATQPNAGDWEHAAGADALKWDSAKLASTLAYECHFFDAGTAALALMRWHTRTGGWPAELAQLVPDYIEAVPRDDWTGEPIQYQIFERGFLLQSPGRDGIIDLKTNSTDPITLYESATAMSMDDEYIAVQLPQS